MFPVSHNFFAVRNNFGQSLASNVTDQIYPEESNSLLKAENRSRREKSLSERERERERENNIKNKFVFLQ